MQTHVATTNMLRQAARAKTVFLLLPLKSSKKEEKEV